MLPEQLHAAAFVLTVAVECALARAWSPDRALVLAVAALNLATFPAALMGAMAGQDWLQLELLVITAEALGLLWLTRLGPLRACATSALLNGVTILMAACWSRLASAI